MQRVEFHSSKGREKYWCDQTLSPVVEFSRCYATEHFIRAGRLYLLDKYWDANKQLVSKSNAFIDWA